jgi:hypothetical protein
MLSRVKHPRQRPPVTLHGVVFNILVGSEHRAATIFQDVVRKELCTLLISPPGMSIDVFPFLLLFELMHQPIEGPFGVSFGRKVGQAARSLGIKRRK